MSKIKVSTLTGALLDYWVAKTEGHQIYGHYMFNHWLGVRTNDVAQFGLGLIIFNDEEREKFSEEDELYSPSTDWSQGGPIIDREGISLGETYTPTSPRKATICNGPANEAIIERGATNLIAAMRCFVASKFGDEVES